MITLIHPHIVKLLDFGIQNGAPYLIMAYAPNRTLRDRHPEGTVLPLPTIISYVKPIAAALQYAHYRRIIHRDVKPENMLLGPHNEIWLSDFGIATTAHSTLSQVIQDKIGTVPYMAPEQIQGKPQSASDQYSLAIVVYEWLTGRCPFDGSIVEIVTQHLTIPPPPFRRDLKISPQVEQVVLKALAKDPQQRFPSVEEFGTSLEQASQQQSTLIVPSPTPQPVSPKQPIQVAQPAQQSAAQQLQVLVSPQRQQALAPIQPALVAAPRRRVPPRKVIWIAGMVLLAILLLFVLVMLFNFTIFIYP